MGGPNPLNNLRELAKKSSKKVLSIFIFEKVLVFYMIFIPAEKGGFGQATRVHTVVGGRRGVGNAATGGGGFI